MTALEADGLVVERDGRVVVSVDHLALEPREVLGVLGPNGAGKTTLLLALATLIPARGTLKVDGAVVADPLAYRRRLGVVFQRPLLLDRTVRENAALGLALRGVGRDARDRAADAALVRLGVAHLAGRPARRLSGGEAQRVAIARALALEPDILLLDEPFTGLDAPTASALIGDLGRVLHESGLATILVTHSRDEALALADRVAVLIDGRIRQSGPTDVVFNRPADEAIAAFVGVENVLPGSVEGSNDDVTLVRVGAHTLSVAEPPPAGGTRVLVLVAPDEIVISRARGASSERNVLEARVVSVEPLGRRVRITLDCSFPLVAHVTRQSVRELALAAGETVVASFKATEPHLLARPGGGDGSDRRA